MTHRVHQALGALVVAAFSFVAFAQANAPATNAPASNAPASTSPETAPIPKPDCGKTSEYPGNLAGDRQLKQWQKDYIAHLECLKKFVEEQQSLAVVHQKARDQAANEYNDEVKAYNDQIQKAKGG